MKAKVYRTCKVTKWEFDYAICTLRIDKSNKFFVKVLLNTDDLFVDFDLEIDKNVEPDIAIKYFEEECMNRFTCFGQFSIEDIIDASGEEIVFY